MFATRFLCLLVAARLMWSGVLYLSHLHTYYSTDLGVCQEGFWDFFLFKSWRCFSTLDPSWHFYCTTDLWVCQEGFQVFSVESRPIAPRRSAGFALPLDILIVPHFCGFVKGFLKFYCAIIILSVWEALVFPPLKLFRRRFRSISPWLYLLYHILVALSIEFWKFFAGFKTLFLWGGLSILSKRSPLGTIIV